MGRGRIADLRAAAATSEREFGADHPTTLRARVLLAIAYRERERTEDAVVELSQVLASYDDTLGPEHPDTLSARHQLALNYFDLSIGGDQTWLSDAIATMERRFTSPSTTPRVPTTKQR